MTSVLNCAVYNDSRRRSRTGVLGPSPPQTPKVTAADEARTEWRVKTLNRMPSNGSYTDFLRLPLASDGELPFPASSSEPVGIVGAGGSDRANHDQTMSDVAALVGGASGGSSMNSSPTVAGSWGVGSMKGGTPPQSPTLQRLGSFITGRKPQ